MQANLAVVIIYRANNLIAQYRLPEELSVDNYRIRMLDTV